MQNVIVFDLDGTLALTEHRNHFLDGEVKNWKGFFEACVDDKPNHPVIETLVSLRNRGFFIIVATGRSEDVRHQTTKWLADNVPGFRDQPFPVHMRDSGDFSQDVVLKTRWLEDGTIDESSIFCVYEDRDSVVKMWRSRGHTCFQVAAGDF